MSKSDNIERKGKIVDKVRLPRTVINHTGCIFPLDNKVCYLVYEYKGELLYKEVSEDKYNEVKL
jgi:hypothetical protein